MKEKHAADWRRLELQTDGAARSEADKQPANWKLCTECRSAISRRCCRSPILAESFQVLAGNQSSG